MTCQSVRACAVMSALDLQMKPQHDVAEVVGRFVTAGEGVVAHWVEYARGVLLFVMAPGDDRSGEFYVYDRRRGRFWLLEMADGVFGGYGVAEMRTKIREFGLLDFAQEPSRLAGLQ
ncbi:MAG: hypothetical protein LC130_17150 [Bryobacterales bacterium]|nr:hypothetical protein [Bryobacterales bacterium]